MELSFLQLIETEANLVGAVGIEIASPNSKPHRVTALPIWVEDEISAIFRQAVVLRISSPAT
jgi:hypothetical protein